MERSSASMYTFVESGSACPSTEEMTGSGAPALSILDAALWRKSLVPPPATPAAASVRLIASYTAEWSVYGTCGAFRLTNTLADRDSGRSSSRYLPRAS